MKPNFLPSGQFTPEFRDWQKRRPKDPAILRQLPVSGSRSAVGLTPSGEGVVNRAHSRQTQEPVQSNGGLLQLIVALIKGVGIVILVILVALLFGAIGGVK